MVNTSENTEQKIIDAARIVFILKGMDGARMQEIADEAGINKALLHYYFRSKTKLFDRVFIETFAEIAQLIGGIVQNCNSIEQLIDQMVTGYISLLKAKPFVPDFVLHELNRNPQIIVQQIKLNGINFLKFNELIDQAVKQQLIRPIHPIHFVVNILSLCVFPFVAKPIIMGFMLNDDENMYNQFIDERIDHVTSFIKSSVFINDQKK